MTVVLCDRFPALEPFAVYQQPFVDVLLLFEDLLLLFEDLKQNLESETIKKANGGKSPPAGSFVHGNTLYVPAQNDDWY